MILGLIGQIKQRFHSIKNFHKPNEHLCLSHQRVYYINLAAIGVYIDFDIPIYITYKKIECTCGKVFYESKKP